MTLSKTTPIIMATRKYGYMLGSIMKADADMRKGAEPGFEPANLESFDFPDGEPYDRVHDDVDGREVIIIGGSVSADDTLELYDLGCAMQQYGALKLKFVLCWYGHQTMEVAQKFGEVVKAKTRARLFSSIPNAQMGNRFMMVELHVPGMQHYFEGDSVRQYINTKDIIADIARTLGGNDFVIVSPDVGRSKQVQKLSDMLNIPYGFVIKRRVTENGKTRTYVEDVSAEVNGKIVVMYDDMIRTGGSLIEAAHALKDRGASKIYAIATHGVFPYNPETGMDAVERLRKDGTIDKIVTTDSHPRAIQLAKKYPDYLEIKSVAPLVCKLLKESVRLL